MDKITVTLTRGEWAEVRCALMEAKQVNTGHTVVVRSIQDILNKVRDQTTSMKVK